MARRKIATDDSGAIIYKENAGMFDNYDAFQEKLQQYRNNDKEIIRPVEEAGGDLKRLGDIFHDLVKNFRAKDELIRKCSEVLRSKIEELKAKTKPTESTSGTNEEKNYETELKKLEVEKLEMFKFLVNKELKREEDMQQDYMKIFMTYGVINDLAPKTSDN